MEYLTKVHFIVLDIKSNRTYRHGGVVEAEGVGVGAAEGGAVVADEPPGQEPNNKRCGKY